MSCSVRANLPCDSMAVQKSLLGSQSMGYSSIPARWDWVPLRVVDGSWRSLTVAAAFRFRFSNPKSTTLH